MDTVSKEKRSEIMSKVRGKNTAPERTVRSLLHSLGFRFRLYRQDLPGKPDIVLPKYKTAVFVNGCFWHGHDCKLARLPKSNIEYWHNKISRNKSRDTRVVQQLRELGWNVYVIWECEIKNIPRLKQLLLTINRSGGY